MLFAGVERGFYARVSRLGTQWLELDLHFLSLGGGEIALGWWFEECLVPYLVNTSKLEAVQSISIVTGYGKTRARGARLNDDGMRLRVRAMLKYMNIEESPQPNKGRIHINKMELITEVKKNNGKVNFDLEGYTRFKEEETTANKFPDVPQKVRARFRPARPGEGPAGTFIRDGIDNSPGNSQPDDGRRDARRDSPHREGLQNARRESRRSSYEGDDRRGGEDWHNERRASQMERQTDRRGSYGDNQERRGSSYVDNSDRRGSYVTNQDRRGSYEGQINRRGSYDDRRGGHEGNAERKESYEGNNDRRPGYEGNNDRRSLYEGNSDRRSLHEGNNDRRASYADIQDRRGSYDDTTDRRRSRDWEGGEGLDRRVSRELDVHDDRPRLRDDTRGDRGSEREEYRRDDVAREPRRYEDREQIASRSSFQRRESSYHVDDRRYNDEDMVGRFNSNAEEGARNARDFRFAGRDRQGGDRAWDRDGRDGELGRDHQRDSDGRPPGGPTEQHHEPGARSAAYVDDHRKSFIKHEPDDTMQLRKSFVKHEPDDTMHQPIANGDLENGGMEGSAEDASRKRGFDEFQKQQANRGYNIEPAFSKKRSI
jgi:hypothetical protein